MKVLLGLFLILCSAFVQAEQTLCVENNAKGHIHLMSSNKVVATGVGGKFRIGTWALFGETQVHIVWQDGAEVLIPKDYFDLCTI